MRKLHTWLASLQELGAGRLKLLAVVTGGHFGIHWFQQLFPVVLPSLKAQLGLSDVQVGALSSARQLINGAMDLPCGILADSLARRRAALLARLRGVITLAKNSTFLGITLATSFMQMGRVIVITFLPIYLQEHLGYSPFALGVYLALLHAMGTVSQPIMGHLSDRFGRKTG